MPAGLVELVDDRAKVGEIAQARGHDNRIRSLVGADLDVRFEDGQRRGMAGLRPASRGHGARDDLGQGLCQLDGVGVLQGEDVNLTLAALRNVESSNELENPEIRALGRDDDDRVAAFVGQDLRDVHVAAHRGRTASRLGRRSTLANVEHLRKASHDVGRAAVVNRLNPYLIADAAHVDVLQDPHHPLDVGSRVRNDEEIPRSVDGDVAVLRFEVAEDARDLLGVRVAQAVKPRDEAVFARRGLTCHVDGDGRLRVG